MRRAWRGCGAILVGLLSFAGFAGAQAQGGNGRIEGALRGPGDKPLAGIEVSLVETGAKVTTDSAGNFAFGDVAPGTYTVLYSYDLLADTASPRPPVPSKERLEGGALRRHPPNPTGNLASPDAAACPTPGRGRRIAPNRSPKLALRVVAPRRHP